MNQRVFVALLTVIVFAAGYAARGFVERGRPVPPPPPALAREYTSAATPQGAKPDHQLDRAKLVAEIEKLRPQIEAYRTQVEEIDGEFERDFSQLLQPGQREKFVATQKRWSERTAKRLASRAPLTDEDIFRARERPLTEIYRMVTVTPGMDWFTKEYNLDASQQTQLRAVLALRRTKFLALLDSTPHPSIRLSRLAPLLPLVVPPPK